MRFGLTAIKNVGEGAIESLLGVRTKQGRITSLARALRGPRSAPGQQARVREPDQGRRVRFARAKARATTALPTAAAAAAAPGRRRRGVRARRAAAARSRARGRRSCSAAERATSTSAAAAAHRRHAAGGGAVDRDRAARLREGNARPLLERPSGRSLRRRAQAVRRARPIADLAEAQPVPDARRRVGAGRPQADGGRHLVGGIVAACRQLKTRKGDRMAVFTLEDAHGGVEIVVFPGGLPARRGADRERHAGPGARQARARRRDGARSWRPRSRRSTACASGWRARWRST